MTDRDILCIYLVGFFLSLWIQIYHERRFEYGMNFTRFMGALGLACLSYVSFIGFLIFMFSEFLESHGSSMIFTDYRTVHKIRAEQRAKRKKWDK